MTAMQHPPSTRTKGAFPVPEWPTGQPGGGEVHPVYVECRTCAFEPAEQLLLPRGRCPKCHSIDRTPEVGKEPPPPRYQFATCV